MFMLCNICQVNMLQVMQTNGSVDIYINVRMQINIPYQHLLLLVITNVHRVSFNVDIRLAPIQKFQKYEINHDFSRYYCFLYLEGNICNVSLQRTDERRKNRFLILRTSFQAHNQVVFDCVYFLSRCPLPHRSTVGRLVQLWFEVKCSGGELDLVGLFTSVPTSGLSVHISSHMGQTFDDISSVVYCCRMKSCIHLLITIQSTCNQLDLI